MLNLKHRILLQTILSTQLLSAVIEVNDLMSMDASYDCLVDIIKSDPGAFTECGPVLDFIYEDAFKYVVSFCIICC